MAIRRFRRPSVLRNLSGHVNVTCSSKSYPQNLNSQLRGVERAKAMTLLCGRGRILISLIRCVRAFMGIVARKRSRVFG